MISPFLAPFHACLASVGFVMMLATLVVGVVIGVCVSDGKWCVLVASFAGATSIAHGLLGGVGMGDNRPRALAAGMIGAAVAAFLAWRLRKERLA